MTDDDGDGPARGDGPTAVFWEALGEGRLLLQRCTTCGTTFHRPRLVCPSCGSTAWRWIESAGAGQVYSATTVMRAVGAFREEAPYELVLVDLDEGARVFGRVARGQPAIGGQVRFVLGRDGAGRPRVEFEEVAP